MHWKEYILTYPNVSRKIYIHIETLEANGYPVIIDFKHLAFIVGIKPFSLAAMVNGSYKFYRSFAIPKRNSDEKRIITTPYPSLKHVQNWIRKNILDKTPVSSSCYAYKTAVSIIDNAKPHLNNNTVYKIDLRHFFDTINFERVITVFLNCGYTPKVSYYLANLCCLNFCLPQGAPTSPSLSNIICNRLDKRCQGLSNSFRITYTRYADDMTFSGERISKKFQILIRELINQEGFELNVEKEILLIGKKKKIVTGISISNGKLQLPRKQRRALKLDCYKFLKHNYKLDPEKNDFDPLFSDRLLGRLYYWKHIEKENAQIDTLISNVKNHVIELTQKFKEIYYIQ